MSSTHTHRRVRELEKMHGGPEFVLIVADDPPTPQQVQAADDAREAGQTVVRLDRADVLL